jgi:hypothetical protein
MPYKRSMAFASVAHQWIKLHHCPAIPPWPKKVLSSSFLTDTITEVRAAIQYLKDTDKRRTALAAEGFFTFYTDEDNGDHP